ncbi:MAG: hypothetical protein LBQ12_10720 [Deltaproteobacteria bacterium]|nr:hypothetical protein [Deltaproteobacteria bacterium]
MPGTADVFAVVAGGGFAKAAGGFGNTGWVGFALAVLAPAVDGCGRFPRSFPLPGKHRNPPP